MVAVLGERGSCSGTVLVKPRGVLTAAHCLPATEVHFDARLPEVPVAARLGARVIAARAIGSWTPGTRDLAVLWLAPFDNGVRSNVPDRFYVPASQGSSPLAQGQRVVIAGYGPSGRPYPEDIHGYRRWGWTSTLA